ncbi:hypothetical protein [Roseicella sp. DB1501]|uniref:hypothetical protein n=1 Tax=Roseicella sp. DB1501 TaxID=2730925 RepID=UPI0014917BA4|nr:hypothetical protein [Roseicella sp. DB1501]NOG70464.1 hypothetical protein [Roseicella sp. DB1501]
MSVNTNCLEGMACPKCKSLGPFVIQVSTRMLIEDEGSTGEHDDLEWTDKSSCRCKACDHEGVLLDFKVEETFDPDISLVSALWRFIEDGGSTEEFFELRARVRQHGNLYDSAPDLRDAAQDALTELEAWQMSAPDDAGTAAAVEKLKAALGTSHQTVN